jgi:hypothetical protein
MGDHQVFLRTTEHTEEFGASIQDVICDSHAIFDTNDGRVTVACIITFVIGVLSMQLHRYDSKGEVWFKSAHQRR